MSAKKPDVARARQRARRMLETIEATIPILDELAKDRDTAEAEKLAALVDRWWRTFGSHDADHEFRMRFVVAVERKDTSPAQVRDELLARCSPDDVARFTDEQIAEAIAVGRKQGRAKGPKKWPTLARILDGSEAHANQLEEEHRDWSDLARRERRLARRRAKD